MKPHYSQTGLTWMAAGLLAISISSCVVPVNLNFESARMLAPGTTEIQGSASTYSIGKDNIRTDQLNAGLKVGLGISDKYNLKLKAEGMFTGGSDQFSYRQYFFEVDNKFSLSNTTALSLPLGFYTDFQYKPIWQFDPRMYITVIQEPQFDLSIIPKCHMIYASDFSLNPGLSIGAGFSKDMSKWVVRPEIGIDRVSISAGVAVSFILR